MCTGDGNPKPEVTITGLYNGNDTGKEVVELEIMEKKVFWCQAHNSRGPVVSRNLIGNAAGVLLYCSFRVSNQSVLPCFPYFGCLPEDKRYAVSYFLCIVDPSEFERTQEVEGRLRVTDIEYDDQFNDKNSKEYLIFTGRFVEQVCLEYFINLSVL